MNKICLFLLFIFVSQCHLFSETKYKINNLCLDQTHSYAYCINNLSEICGTFTVSNSEGRYNSTFYWSPENGLMELPEGAFFTPYNMNDAGLIVGDKHTITKMPNGSNKGLFVGCMMNAGGLFENLDKYHPKSINNNNISVGDYAVEIQNPRDSYSHTPYQKTQENVASPIDSGYNSNLNLAERYRGKKRHCKKVESIVSSINNLNEIVGTVTAYGVPMIDIPGGCISHAFLLTGSEMIDIGKNYSAIDINDKSKVLLVETGKRFTTSLVWDNGNFITLWQGGWPKAINNHGLVVGSIGDGAAVIWENGQLNLLYDLLENPEGWEKLCIAEDINDRGEIVGYGIYNSNQTAFLLTPCE